MKNQFKQGDRIYFLRPVSGLCPTGSEINDNWGEWICEVRLGVYVESDQHVMAQVRVIEKGDEYSRAVPTEYVFKLKAAAEKCLERHNKMAWHNIFRIIAKLQGDVFQLQENNKKIKEIFSH